MKAPLRFHLARRLLRLLLSLVFRVQADGLEQLPIGRSYLLACNHLSWVDPFILIAWLPASPRLNFLGKRSAIYNRPFKRWILRLMGGVIPVETGDLQHLSEAVSMTLRRGGVAVIFPEGAVGPTEGRLQPLRRGIAHFSVDNRAPVVVVGLAGTHELWRGKQIRLRVGTTLWPEQTVSMDSTLRTIETALAEAIPPLPATDSRRRPWPWLTDLLR